MAHALAQRPSLSASGCCDDMACGNMLPFWSPALGCQNVMVLTCRVLRHTTSEILSGLLLGCRILLSQGLNKGDHYCSAHAVSECSLDQHHGVHGRHGDRLRLMLRHPKIISG